MHRNIEATYVSNVEVSLKWEKQSKEVAEKEFFVSVILKDWKRFTLAMAKAKKLE